MAGSGALPVRRPAGGVGGGSAARITRFAQGADRLSAARGDSLPGPRHATGAAPTTLIGYLPDRPAKECVMTTPPPDGRAPDADGPAGESAGQASAFRRALDAQAEDGNSGHALIPAAPHDLTVPIDRVEIRKALDLDEEPQESAAATANLQNRIPAWMPHVHTMPPSETTGAETATAETAVIEDGAGAVGATRLIPAQQTASPETTKAAPAPPRPPARYGVRRMLRRLPLTAAICLVIIAAIAFALAESDSSPKAPSPLTIPSASAVSQAPSASAAGSGTASASCAAGHASSCSATSSATASASASASSASPSAQHTSPASGATASAAASSPVNVPLGTSNLALNRTVSASGYTQTYAPANAVDGNTSTYWESTDSDFPQWFRIDLGSVTALGALVIDLPPSSSWETRTQTIQIQGSTNGSSYSTIEPAAGYTFNPATGNTVTIDLPAGTSARYLQLTFTANTVWPAGQISELEVFS
jgi:hypothetical protein